MSREQLGSGDSWASGVIYGTPHYQGASAHAVTDSAAVSSTGMTPRATSLKHLLLLLGQIIALAANVVPIFQKPTATRGL